MLVYMPMIYNVRLKFLSREKIIMSDKTKKKIFITIGLLGIVPIAIFFIFYWLLSGYVLVYETYMYCTIGGEDRIKDIIGSFLVASCGLFITGFVGWAYYDSKDF